MVRRFFTPQLLCIVSCLSAPAALASGYGFDVLVPPQPYATQLEAAGLTGLNGTWMRVRGLTDSHRPGTDNARTVEIDRAGLQALRNRGLKTTVFLRWNSDSWVQGTRSGGGHRMPLDLREAYERARRLGVAYGDLVDVWEIDNEPDISFCLDNPETYAAFLKAAYLGIKDGLRENLKREPQNPRPHTSADTGLGVHAAVLSSDWLERKRGLVLSSGLRPQTADSSPASRVIMAPLALPPGPYMERLWANGIASYTDGFNFHYYGYAGDFTGVYRQFEDAVDDLDSCHRSPNAGDRNMVTKSMPVFITEYGYGLLDSSSRETVEGRVRQWRWFSSLACQLQHLRPEAPMAFLLDPYFEANLNEFGLTTREPMRMEGLGDEKLETGNLNSEAVGDKTRASHVGPQRSPAVLKPSDFGTRDVLPWMRDIGKKIGEVHASPALAFLWDYAKRNPYRPRSWTVKASPASPVVIDFIAGPSMAQEKSSGGYVLQGASTEWTPAPVRTGRGRLILYNFNAHEMTGVLDIAAPSPVTSSWDKRITLEPGERREIPVEITISGETPREHLLRARFQPHATDSAESVFTTTLLPASYGMTAMPVAAFDFPESIRGRARLQARPLEVGEPRLYRDGRWLVTEGVRVEERADGIWRFHIDYLPAEPLRPAVVELPLPEGFIFEAGTLLSLERRKSAREEGEKPEDGRRMTEDRCGDGKPENGDLKPEGWKPRRNFPKAQLSGHKTPASGNPGLRFQASALPSPTPSPSQLKSRAGRAGDMMDVYFRTENGNLYQTWPRLRVNADWSRYIERAENFTMAFFGRAELPWRFTDNKPASLVFFLRPAELPAVFEVRDAQIIRLKASD
jgi:hypothetical protein